MPRRVGGTAMSPLTPVVCGTAGVLVQACRFLRAGMGNRNGTAGRVMVRANKCSARARIVFGKPQPEAQRAA